MGKKGGRNRLKRISAPRQWDVLRKEHRFAIKPSPGPYSVDRSYPLGLAMRDLLDLVATRREAEKVLYRSQVLVDGVARHDTAFPVGLFNVIEVPNEELAFRLIPSPDGLAARRVSMDQARLKLCRVMSKSKVDGGHIQYGFHDGRSMQNDSLSLSPGDSVLMRVPEQNVVSGIRLTKGSLGMIISGERAGEMGKITEVKKGTASRERMVSISLPEGEKELPARLIFPVGAGESPALEVQPQ